MNYVFPFRFEIVTNLISVSTVNRYNNYRGNWVLSSDGRQVFCVGDFAYISI